MFWVFFRFKALEWAYLCIRDESVALLGQVGAGQSDLKTKQNQRTNQNAILEGHQKNIKV